MLEKKNNELIEKGNEKEKDKSKPLSIDTHNDLEIICQPHAVTACVYTPIRALPVFVVA